MTASGHSDPGPLTGPAGVDAAGPAPEDRRRPVPALALRTLGDPSALDRIVVATALARLPAAQREVLSLARYADLTQPPIAARTGLPLGTVESHAHHGLLRLREDLTPALRPGP
ncbi:sigma factor-like helix-turn-helix DNA-binding protein [Streptomyces hydrogenans]|uniref:sigma factor-like helix-turn-helix DNA-binding protein n=1 Tax=Streptomyces hydrogenans TaxID=1873719 RepID=UPI003F555DCE